MPDPTDNTDRQAFSHARFLDFWVEEQVLHLPRWKDVPQRPRGEQCRQVAAISFSGNCVFNIPGFPSVTCEHMDLCIPKTLMLKLR